MANRNENDHIRRLPSASEHPPSLEGDGPSHDGGQNLWSLVSDRLSGRWKGAIALGLALAVLGAVFGYRSASVQFESTGIVHVAPKTNYIMRDIPETGMVPLYPAFVQTQATLISSQRVIDRALNSLEMDELPWSDRIQAMRGVRRNLEARSQRNSELIHVKFTHGSPDVAQTVVNAVINSYAELFASADGDEINQRLRKLREIRERRRHERHQKQAQMQELVASSEYAFNDLDKIISHKAMRIQTIDAEIRRLEHALAESDASGEGWREPNEDGDGLGYDPVTGAPIDYRDLEAFDKELGRLARVREDARTSLEYARERFFPEHRAYQRAEQDYRVANRLYRERQAVVVREFLESDRLPMANWAAEPQQRLEQLRREAEEERRLMQRMTQSQLELTELQNELEEIEQELADTNARIRGLEIEADSIRRITIASLGELPSQPARDRRRPLAAVGALGGFGAGIGFFFLLATLDRRVYAVRQLGAAVPGPRLLGVLPALPSEPGNVEASGVAAHCVHQIRNRIEAARKPGKSAVLVVSSPYQGDGKTSLTLALAASYASSGYRTILVDCDMIARSITHHLMMTGESGLQECLRTGRIDEFVKPLKVDNLSVLPVGDDPGFGPEKVRKADLDLLFQRLRRDYDVILVDTGPLFGSVESLPVASASDGIVLTMRRGRRQTRLEECISAIQSTGSSFLGFVLNYAQTTDCNRYVSSSKSSALVDVTGGGIANGASRGRHGQSRNALLRAMQATSRPTRSKYAGAVHDSKS